jgi:hypothetical protein
MKRKCPICKKVFEVDRKDKHSRPEWFPFCSQRCKLIDLGAWLDDQYKIISTPPDKPEETDQQ